MNVVFFFLSLGLLMTGDDNSQTVTMQIIRLSVNHEIRVFTSIPLKKHKTQNYTISENCKQLSAEMFHYGIGEAHWRFFHVLRSSGHDENKRLV